VELCTNAGKPCLQVFSHLDHRALRKRWSGVLNPAEMKTLEQVESDIRMLPPDKQEALRDWLENLLEDQLVLTDEFQAKIERGEQDLRTGRSRITKSN
jgi:hypothetical protein